MVSIEFVLGIECFRLGAVTVEIVMVVPCVPLSDPKTTTYPNRKPTLTITNPNYH